MPPGAFNRTTFMSFSLYLWAFPRGIWHKPQAGTRWDTNGSYKFGGIPKNDHRGRASAGEGSINAEADKGLDKLFEGARNLRFRSLLLFLRHDGTASSPWLEDNDNASALRVGVCGEIRDRIGDVAGLARRAWL
jgi:hypothetical protein